MRATELVKKKHDIEDDLIAWSAAASFLVEKFALFTVREAEIFVAELVDLAVSNPSDELLQCKTDLAEATLKIRRCLPEPKRWSRFWQLTSPSNILVQYRRMELRLPDNTNHADLPNYLSHVAHEAARPYAKTDA